jgi:hypothetical protein
MGGLILSNISSREDLLDLLTIDGTTGDTLIRSAGLLGEWIGMSPPGID